MQQRTYGWRRQLPDQRDFLFEPTVSALTVPDRVDLRPDFALLPVYDQGALGSCTANSVAAALWHMMGVRKGLMASPNPARLFIYYTERMLGRTTRTDSGATVRDSLRAVDQYGACDEGYWPYLIDKFKIKPGKAQFATALTECRLGSYEAVPQTTDALQMALAGGFPVCIGFSVYQSFESAEVAKTGLVPLPKRTEALLGGHAVLLVGYDVDRQVFIVRNSWGEHWGDAGYCYLPYAYVLNPKLAADFWVIRS